MSKVYKKAESQLVDSAFSSPVSTSSTSLPDFVHKLLHHPNAKEAATFVAQHAEQLILSEHGASMRGLELEIEEVDRQFLMLRGRAIELESRMSKTPRYMRTEVPEGIDVKGGSGHE